MEAPAKKADKNKIHGFLSPFRKNKAASIFKASPTFASKPTLENCIDQGDIARRKLVKRAR